MSNAGKILKAVSIAVVAVAGGWLLSRRKNRNPVNPTPKLQRCPRCGKSVPEGEISFWTCFKMSLIGDYFRDVRESMRVCADCYQQLSAKYEEARQAYEWDLQAARAVKLVSKNYLGRVDIVAESLQDEIVSDYFEDKDDARLALQLMAHKQGCNIILQVNEVQGNSVEIGPNRFRSTWAFSGTPAKQA